MKHTKFYQNMKPKVWFYTLREINYPFCLLYVYKL